MTRLSWLTFILITLFGCTACFDFSKGSGTECESDGDCLGDERCFTSGLLSGSSCQPPCTCDDECREDARCIVPVLAREPSTRCVSGGCRLDSDCPGDRICQLLHCVEGCREDADCSEGEICSVDSTCQTASCRADTECPEGEICFDGSCSAGCREDADCLAEERCARDRESLTGACLLSACGNDEECGGGLRCVCGHCLERCESDEECDDGERCTATYDECGDARCLPSPLRCGEEACAAAENMEPCCIEGERPRCGFAISSSSAPRARCGEIYDPSTTCDVCDDEACCLSSGEGCGYPFSPLGRFGPSFCIPYDPVCADGAL